MRYKSLFQQVLWGTSPRRPRRYFSCNQELLGLAWQRIPAPKGPARENADLTLDVRVRFREDAGPNRSDFQPGVGMRQPASVEAQAYPKERPRAYEKGLAVAIYG